MNCAHALGSAFGTDSDEMEPFVEVMGTLLNGFGSRVGREGRKRPETEEEEEEGELRNAFVVEGVNAVEEIELFLALIGRGHLTEL